VAPIRILVVDDNLHWRSVICAILNRSSGWRIVGEASDGLEAIQKSRELQPDLVVLDIGLPEVNGFHVARKIAAFAPHSKILFLSAQLSPNLVEEALRVGAYGYVAKLDAALELLPAVEAVLGGERFVSQRFARQGS
jgi:DNA-binding NarL/FixJ family response regulator